MASTSTLRITWLWALLVFATALSWEFGHGFGVGGDPRQAATLVLAIAFLKARVVFLDFMELRHAPRGLRLAVEAWALGVGGTLVGLCWLGG